jgi:3-oxoacyl-[acyl-carrier protein] reductase
MDLQLSGKTALVTGASRGLGRAIASGLAAEGVRVALAARRVGLLEELAQEILAAGGAEPAILEVDLYQPGAPERLAAEALADLGRIDILINAAGGSRPLPLEASSEQWEEALLLNFVRLRELTHAVLPGMIEQRSGRIVNLTGTSEPRSLNAANSAKAAIHAWSKGISREVARHGVTINCLQPGHIISEQILRRYPTEAQRQEVIAREIPVGRFGQPIDLANLAVFLASPLTSYITGTVIPVDGGMSRFAF